MLGFLWTSHCQSGVAGCCAFRTRRATHAFIGGAEPQPCHGMRCARVCDHGLSPCSVAYSLVRAVGDTLLCVSALRGRHITSPASRTSQRSSQCGRVGPAAYAYLPSKQGKRSKATSAAIWSLHPMSTIFCSRMNTQTSHSCSWGHTPVDRHSQRTLNSIPCDGQRDCGCRRGIRAMSAKQAMHAWTSRLTGNHHLNCILLSLAKEAEACNG